MPIKVRCKECSAVFAVSEKAAGKAVKCKECGGRIAVPAAAGGGGASPAAAPGAAGPPKKKPRPRPAAAPPSNPDDLFGGLDLRRAEDHSQKICPACAAAVDEEDIECPNCGVNIETGTLSEEQRKRRSRKGPPPEEYYKNIWSNGWKFAMAHKGFIFQTGLVWGISATMVIASAFVLKWYWRTRADELVASASTSGVTISDTAVVIEPGEGDAEYDGVKYTSGSTLLKNGKRVLPSPYVAAILSPPSYFWCFIFLIFVLSFGGWAWTLSAKVVDVTLQGEKKIKRFQTDMFGNMTKGFTTIFWPIILLYPIIWIPAAMAAAGASPTASGITFIAMFLFPYIVFLPIAVVHMAQNYTYRAWLINWMTKDFFNTLGPTLYTSGIFFVLVLLLPLGIAGGIAAGWNQFADFYTNRLEVPALGATMGYTIADADFTGSFIFKRLPFLLGVSFLSLTLLFTLVAIPAVFMMRVFGLFGLYFRPDLDLCFEQPPMSPAGFGPRFLAMHVDAVVAGAMCLAAVVASGFISGLVGMLYNSETIQTYAWYGALAVTIGGSLLFYFAKWESGANRATLGKWSLGLMVLQDDGQPVPFDLAIKRAAASVTGILSLGGTFIMCAFRGDHRAAHDLMTKTKVVWRGDENV
ncbi:MAG: RDD family protein [Planctomycetaceae bacterium]|nr:RDD family protein [Planctomycetaceae bacterium]